MTDEEKYHLLAVCDSIIESDEANDIKNIIIWPDKSKPDGTATILLRGDPGETGTDVFLAANETEARALRALLNAAGPGTPLAQVRS